MPDTSPTLCPIVEGIRFTFLHAGRPVRGLVLSDALETVFGSDHHPAAWMSAFARHERDIVEAARRRFLQEPLRQPVLVNEAALEDLPHAVARQPEVSSAPR